MLATFQAYNWILMNIWEQPVNRVNSFWIGILIVLTCLALFVQFHQIFLFCSVMMLINGSCEFHRFFFLFWLYVHNTNYVSTPFLHHLFPCGLGSKRLRDQTFNYLFPASSLYQVNLISKVELKTLLNPGGHQSLYSTKEGGGPFKNELSSYLITHAFSTMKMFCWT